MASKVNVKFVVILSSVLVLVFAGVAATAYFVLTKSGDDHLRLGNQAMDEGDYKLAEKHFSKAVNHDIQNLAFLTRWRDALEHYAPELRADYESKFQDYYSLHQMIAQAGRTDVGLHMQNLQFQWDAMSVGASSPASVVVAVTTASEFFEGMPDNAWQTILRYRGLARVLRLTLGDQLEEVEIERASQDLTRALEANPDDGESLVGLARLAAYASAAALAEGDSTRAAEQAGVALDLVESFVAEHPDDATARLALVLLRLDPSLRSALGRGDEVDRDALGEELTTIASMIRAMEPSSVDQELLSLFRRGESIQKRSREFTPLTRSIVDWLADELPQNAKIRFLRASLMAAGKEYASAIAEYQTIVEMPNLPIGLDGFWLMNNRDIAVYQQMGLAFKLWESPVIGEDTDAANARRADAVAQMERFKDELVTRMPADSPRLEMARAQLAYASGDRGTARRLLESYALSTEYADPQSLWLLAQTAIQVQNWADAQENLTRLIALNPGDYTAMLTLAEVYSMQGDDERALAIYDGLAQFNPDNTLLNERRDLLRARTGVGSSGNAATDAIIEAGQIQRGTGLIPGDAEAAIERLTRAIDELGLDPRLIAQLSSMQLEIGRIDEAKATLRRGLEASPDNEFLARLSPILEADDVQRARLLIIDSSPINEQSKLVSKSRIFSIAGNDARAIELLNEALQIAPDDPGVIEMLFQASLRTKDQAAAERYAKRAIELDLDALGGLTYEARLADSRGDQDRALDLMRQATEKAPDNVAVIQMLGRLQLALGRTTAGLETYRSAMRLRGTDARLITDFVRQLQLAGRQREALDVLRSAEPHIKGNRLLLDQRLALEASVGDRAMALEARRSILAREPDNASNKAALADLMMDHAMWSESRGLIDELRAGEDALNLAVLDARWYARQGEVDKATEVFTAYLSSLLAADIDQNMAAPYLALGALLLEYGDTTGGMASMETALRWDDETMWVQKIRSDWLMRLGHFAEAVDSNSAIVDAGLDDAQNTHRKRLARSLTRLDRADEAANHIEVLDERRSLDPEVLIIESEVATGQGETRRARELLDEAVRLFSSTPRVFERRAMLIAQQADEAGSNQLFRDAIGDLDSALRLEPLAWRPLRLRGYVRLRLGEDELGLADLRASVLASAQNNDLLTGVMSEFIKRDRSFDAASLATEIIAERPSDLKLMLACGSVFAGVDDWTRAHTYYEQAWKRIENNETGTLYVRSLIKRRPPRWAEANQALNKLDEIVEDNPALLMARAMVRQNLNREPAAHEDAVKAARVLQSRREAVKTPTVHLALRSWFDELKDTFEPEAVLAVIETLARGAPVEDTEMIQILRANALIEIDGRRDEGLALLEQIADTSTDDRIAHRALNARVAALMIGEAYAEAVSVIRAGIVRYPKDWQLLNNLAYTLADKLDQPEEAMGFAQQAVNLQPNIAELRDTLGVAQMGAGRLDEAAATLEQALVLAGRSRARPVVALHLAMVMYEQKKPEEARRYLAIIEESEHQGLVLSASDKTKLDELVVKINSLG